MSLFDIFKKKETVTLGEHDLHNHLLPGVDDGFKHTGDSLHAIRLMAEAGVRHITFTPHMNPDVYKDESEQHFREVYAEFAPMVKQHLAERLPGTEMKLNLAAEYMVVKGFEDRAANRADELLCHPDGSILIEQSYFYESPNLEQAVFELCMAGKKPILAHPERYLYMAGQWEQFDKLVEMGCRLQMNLMSLSGTYGPASMKILHHLLDHGMYTFCATDLHTVPQLHKILSLEIDSKMMEQVRELQGNRIG